MEPHLVNRSWLDDVPLKQLMSVLNVDGEETRIIGGAVRDALLGEVIADIDLATTAVPERVRELCEAAGFKAVDTGIDHGTLTIVVEGVNFQVTTLRKDVETDGRHANVVFGRDWTEDAARRDLTMNALSIDHKGEVHDPIGGYADLVRRDVKFIGDPQTRIEEDYLRSLRYFRFFAWYGVGRPDRDALRAVVRTKAGLETLSVERIWSELKKILQARSPERAILWMRTTEIFNVVLPENWGLDQFHWLLNAEGEQNWSPDPLQRLQAMLRPTEDVINALADRLKFSNDERSRLIDWSEEATKAAAYVDLSVLDLAKVLYRGKRNAIRDALVHEFAKRFNKEEAGAGRIPALLEFIDTWEKPELPVSGEDLIKAGYAPGPNLGNKLKELEENWIESGFTLGRDDLLS
ncbi:MAG: CCA tRNA nucleotidyltransferase [Hyphomicrobiales bacterium]